VAVPTLKEVVPVGGRKVNGKDVIHFRIFPWIKMSASRSQISGGAWMRLTAWMVSRNAKGYIKIVKEKKL